MSLRERRRGVCNHFISPMSLQATQSPCSIVFATASHEFLCRKPLMRCALGAHTCVWIWVSPLLLSVKLGTRQGRARQPRTPSFASSGMPTLVFMQKSASKVQQPQMCFQLTQALDVDGVGGRVSMGLSTALLRTHVFSQASYPIRYVYCLLFAPNSCRNRPPAVCVHRQVGPRWGLAC